MNASGVSLMPSPAARSFSEPRSTSSSVMSASSCCVTCGRLTQARLQPRAGDLLDAAERLDLDRAERREIDVVHARQGRPGRCRRRQRLLDERFHVVVRDAALDAAAVDLREVDAELARKTAHRRAGMGARETAVHRRGRRRRRGVGGAAPVSGVDGEPMPRSRGRGVDRIAIFWVASTVSGWRRASTVATMSPAFTRAPFAAWTLRTRPRRRTERPSPPCRSPA